MKAVELDDKYGVLPVQVCVVQSKEPDHFLLVFKGKMVVHSGGCASSFKNRVDQDSYDVDGTRLRGTNEFDTRAVQVEEKASFLNSNDCFVLETPECTYIWYGKVNARLLETSVPQLWCLLHLQGCSGDERQLADIIMKVISPGREPVKSWKEMSHRISGMLLEARRSMAQASGCRKSSPRTHLASSSAPMRQGDSMLRRSLILPRM